MRLVLALLLSCCGFAAPAAASLLGQQMTAGYRYPELGTTYPSTVWSPAGFTIGAGVETVGLVENVTSISVDFAANRLTLLLATTLPAPTWGSVDFNGPVFTAAAPLGIIGATVNAATTLAGFDVSRISVTGTEVRIDWAGLSYVDGTRLVVDFQLVPEPAGMALLLAGLGLLGLLRGTAPGRSVAIG
ncbi:PEP-CTERM sorting domain-containing protein [Siccirubricoccus sp. KC 17139]|uniref:PEP-CTERM sorting domain-containing protein n=1 Tax=Siccirubricoccus soli TaxID=2899147 RepID=A0ABT1DEY6_9PROT|nr:PEP-CTERM sorting domain-containing protein [Siccirubricoccus soli]MCO6419520.1 PEP-CTERM sorting domain-containing protein [Siccirubricoccus soli]MCP2685655.1 PEP-CTERM sorting domain-containing protein [Siccirubricoccus soli]